MADPNQSQVEPLPEEVAPDEVQSPGVPVAPDQPVATGPLSPQDLYKLAFNRQLQDPSIYGGGLGGRRLLENPPPGTGVTWATREDGTQTPVTYITGRSPIQPPSGGGVPVPDMNPFVTQAFQHLPVDQAAKAIEVATRYQGQRGYQRDLQSGMSAPQAFAKWAPMLFHSNATGMTEAMRLSAPPQQPQQGPLGVTYGGRFYPKKTPPEITPYQQGQQDLANKRFALEQKKAEDKAAEDAVKAAAKEKELTKPQQEDLKDAYKELDEARKAFDAVPVGNKAKRDATRLKVASAQSRIKAITAGPNPTAPNKPATPEAKVEAAKALRKEHPDWTKQQIIDALK